MRNSKALNRTNGFSLFVVASFLSAIFDTQITISHCSFRADNCKMMMMMTTNAAVDDDYRHSFPKNVQRIGNPKQHFPIQNVQEHQFQLMESRITILN